MTRSSLTGVALLLALTTAVTSTDARAQDLLARRDGEAGLLAPVASAGEAGTTSEYVPSRSLALPLILASRAHPSDSRARASAQLRPTKTRLNHDRKSTFILVGIVVAVTAILVVYRLNHLGAIVTHG